MIALYERAGKDAFRVHRVASCCHGVVQVFDFFSGNKGVNLKFQSSPSPETGRDNGDKLSRVFALCVSILAQSGDWARPVTPGHVRKLCYQGVPERRLPRVKVGRLVCFRPEDVRAWVERNVVPGEGRSSV